MFGKIRQGLPIVLLAAVMLPQAQAQSSAQPDSVAAPPVQQGSVHLGAALYPAPQPQVPGYAGVTYITNHALAPHEMLYPHTYRALYPPYYHRVKGSYMWTPFGMKNHETWELQGTMVQVKYRSHPPLLKGGHAPIISKWGGPWD
ncbi:MAG: hypothetical protein KatS3mg113_1084 [Planctomycetaceae bacterium]|nr:MAG: hypothetical protein KatS3mg113_1084 [Planctomycetaceae bacterium]